jgi:hypothetical protein
MAPYFPQSRALLSRVFTLVVRDRHMEIRAALAKVADCTAIWPLPQLRALSDVF